jgi:hypothetical protein
MESEMAIDKKSRAQFIAYIIVSSVLLTRVTVARGDLGGDQAIGDAAHRTVLSSKSKNDLAKGGGLLHVYPPSEHKDEYRTEKPLRRKKRSFLGHAMQQNRHNVAQPVKRIDLDRFIVVRDRQCIPG